jgi:hypothetical protein
MCARADRRRGGTDQIPSRRISPTLSGPFGYGPAVTRRIGADIYFLRSLVLSRSFTRFSFKLLLLGLLLMPPLTGGHRSHLRFACRAEGAEANSAKEGSWQEEGNGCRGRRRVASSPSCHHSACLHPPCTMGIHCISISRTCLCIQHSNILHLCPICLKTRSRIPSEIPGNPLGFSSHVTVRA